MCFCFYNLISKITYPVVQRESISCVETRPCCAMGGATGECGGQCPPTFGTSGVQGIQEGGPMTMIFASTADNIYSVLYKWLNFNSPDSSRHRCQVNDIWKDGLGRVSTVHPHWTAALFKSTCQHAHAAASWLSMSLRGILAKYLWPLPASSSLIRWYIFACLPHVWKSGVQKFFSAHSTRESCFVPHLKIRGATHVCPQMKVSPPQFPPPPKMKTPEPPLLVGIFDQGCIHIRCYDVFLEIFYVAMRKKATKNRPINRCIRTAI